MLGSLDFYRYTGNIVKSTIVKSGLVPLHLTTQFITHEQVSNLTTRNSQALNIPLSSDSFRTTNLYYRIIRLWNNLDHSLKLSSSVQVFKRRLKNKILDKFLNGS